MKQVDQFMARKRKAEHRSVSDTCWLAVERANDAEHRATRRTVNPSAGSMIEQRGNTHSSEQCVIKGLGTFQIVGADGRSEEGRVGKGCVSTCRSRCATSP